MVNIFRPSTWLRTQTPTSDPSPARGIPQDVGAAPPVAEPAPTEPQRPIRERIEQLAYEKWCAAGSPEGRDMEFWIDAETELLEKENKR